MRVSRAILIIVIALMVGFTRHDFAGMMVFEYEKRTGKQIEVKACPFTDVAANSDACKAHAIGVTVGQTKTEFVPDVKIEPYEAFLMVGRTMMAIRNAK